MSNKTRFYIQQEINQMNGKQPVYIISENNIPKIRLTSADDADALVKRWIAKDKILGIVNTYSIACE